jgi:hypothetical protein
MYLHGEGLVGCKNLATQQLHYVFNSFKTFNSTGQNGADGKGIAKLDQ